MPKITITKTFPTIYLSKNELKRIYDTIINGFNEKNLEVKSSYIEVSFGNTGLKFSSFSDFINYINMPETFKDIYLSITANDGSEWTLRFTGYSTNSSTKGEKDLVEKLSKTVENMILEIRNSRKKEIKTETIEAEKTFEFNNCYLDRNDLLKLNEIILGGSLSNMKVSYGVKSGQATLKSKNLEELFDDPNLPMEFDEFNVYVRDDLESSSARLNCNRYGKSDFSVKGKKEEVESKISQVETFINKHPNPSFFGHYRKLIFPLSFGVAFLTTTLLFLIIGKIIGYFTITSAIVLPLTLLPLLGIALSWYLDGRAIPGCILVYKEPKKTWKSKLVEIIGLIILGQSITLLIFYLL
ncbi:MAG: hypothetical protein L6265_05895 [Thermoplasmatales archaeon]|nr:hypothetical protein [Thermoplasmatales archaeon]